MPKRARRSIEIDRPIAEVWPFVANLEHELTWRAPWVVALEVEGGGALEVGSRVRGTTRILGQTDTYVNEITELSPPRRLAWRGVDVSGGVIGHGAYDLEPLGPDRTRFTLDLTYEAVDPSKRAELWMVGLMAPFALWKLTRQLRALVHERVPAATTRS